MTSIDPSRSSEPSSCATVVAFQKAIYSVDTEEEANALLVMACGTNLDGEFVARELASEQTLENLFAFGDRLRSIHEMVKKTSQGRH